MFAGSVRHRSATVTEAEALARELTFRPKIEANSATIARTTGRDGSRASIHYKAVIDAR